MWQKIKCWLGWHETGLTYSVCYGRVFRRVYCIHCRRILSEEVLINNV